MIYLDSADPADAATAHQLGFVTGITTNPALMSERTLPPLTQLSQLLDTFENGPVFYQVSAVGDPPAASAEAQHAAALSDRVVLKLPATQTMYQLGHDLSQTDTPFAVTGVYTPAQVLVASQVGAEFVIPYVDRAHRLMDEPQLVTSLRSVVDAARSDTKILAASIKSPAQGVEALTQGAHSISAPLTVILELCEHELTRSAIEEFAAKSKSATTSLEGGIEPGA